MRIIILNRRNKQFCKQIENIEPSLYDNKCTHTYAIEYSFFQVGTSTLSEWYAMYSTDKIFEADEQDMTKYFQQDFMDE